MKSVVRYYLLLSSIIFCAICTNARIVKDTPTGTIPFAIAGDSRIYVTAFVNGSVSLRFLVDTGASDVVLNPNSPKLKDRFFWKRKSHLQFHGLQAPTEAVEN